MSIENGGGLEYNEEATKAAIFRALEGRSDEFKLLVLELAVENKWNARDPSFLIQLSVGQMEVLLKQYPAEFASLLTGILEEAENRWAGIQQEWVKAVAIAGQTSKNFESQVNKLEAATGKQVERLEAESEVLIAKGFALSQAHTAKQIEAISKGSMRTHFIQAIGYSCAAAFALAGLSWLGGAAHSNIKQRSSEWGQIQRWNRNQLQACREVRKPTCNLHIVNPEEKKKDE